MVKVTLIHFIEAYRAIIANAPFWLQHGAVRQEEFASGIRPTQVCVGMALLLLRFSSLRSAMVFALRDELLELSDDEQTTYANVRVRTEAFC